MSWEFANEKGEKVWKKKSVFLEEISISGRNGL